MIRSISILAALALSACSVYPGGSQQTTPFPPGMGQYVRPAYLNPVQQPRLPPVDDCRSQLYLGLVGRHEGSIFLAALPERKRILKPAFNEGFEYRADDPLGEEPRLYEVRDYLPDQVLYAPTVQIVSDLVRLGPPQQNRLTIELDQNGYVREVRCE